MVSLIHKRHRPGTVHDPDEIGTMPDRFVHPRFRLHEGESKADSAKAEQLATSLWRPISRHAPTATLAEVERNHIRFILETTRGNRTQAAKILGISPTTLWRKLKQE